MNRVKLQTTAYNKISNVNRLAINLLFGLAIIGCSDNDNNVVATTPAAEFRYQLITENLTNNQPLSPVGFAIHNASFEPWRIGVAASLGLEMLAEGGDTTEFLNDANIVASVTGDAAIMPGASQTLELSVANKDNLMFSAATMLVNSNDAFTGLKQQDIAALEVGDEISITSLVYDSGTEANTESAGTMPGPADNGEGYNVALDDVGFVATHSGVVTEDDGLATSVLNQSHRFEAKVANFRLRRIE